MRWQLRLLFVALTSLLGLQCAMAETRSGKKLPPPPVAAPARPASPQRPIPESARLRLLIYTSLIAINQANVTGNYTVLRDLAAPSFRDANSAARLAEIFKSVRGRNLDLSPILLLDPKLARPPVFLDNGLLRLTGFFPSAPEQVNFDLAFQSVGGKWLLFGVALSTSSSAAAATNGQAASNSAEQAMTGSASSTAKASAAPQRDGAGWLLYGIQTGPAATAAATPANSPAPDKPAR